VVAAVVQVALCPAHHHPLHQAQTFPSRLAQVAMAAPTLVLELVLAATVETHHSASRPHSAVVAAVEGRPLEALVVRVVDQARTAMQILVLHPKASRVALDLQPLAVHQQPVVAVLVESAQWDSHSAVRKHRGAATVVLVHRVPSPVRLRTTPAVVAVVPTTTQRQPLLVVGAVARKTTSTVPATEPTATASTVKTRCPTPEVAVAVLTGKQQTVVLADPEL
jgi:hypothetical protein